MATVLFRNTVLRNINLRLLGPTGLSRHHHPKSHIKTSSILMNMEPHSSKVKMADRLSGTDKNVWVVFVELTRLTGAVNVGQGLPDCLPPEPLVNALREFTSEHNGLAHQCTRAFGLPRLVENIAKMYGPLHNRQIDPMTEILVTNGAYQSLYYSIMGLVNPGDEVIIIEPFFDCYRPMTLKAGGKPIFVPLRPSKHEGNVSSADWKLDMEELASKFTSKTKIIILNTPHNPTGKVFLEEELHGIAELCIKHDVICVADEVYEYLLYPGAKHCRISNIPGMWERTITISSAGKIFTATGWRMGWAIAPAYLMKPLMTIHQNCVYTINTPLQESVARALELEMTDPYLHTLPATLLKKRDYMVAELRKVGMNPIVPEGGYVLLADWTKLGVDQSEYEDGSDDRQDFKFAKWLIKEKGLSTIPPTAFFSEQNKHLGENFVRICFYKQDETLQAAAKILQTFKSDNQ